MRSFSEYLTENKNTHLEHLEDEVFNGGIVGIRKALDFLRHVRNSLAGNVKSPVSITTKWDGAPAIIAGINPENGKFFVATKGVFNKNPKLAYTPKDVEEQFAGNKDLIEKMKVALSELPKLGIKGILQGDFLFTQNKLKVVSHGAEKLLAFRPNTITYTVPLNSDLAKRIQRAKLGIVFHTTYTGTKIATLKGSFGADVSKLNKVPSVWATDATFRDESGAASLTADETMKITEILSEIGSLFNQADSSVVNGIAADDNLKLLIKTYINSKIKIGKGIAGTKVYVRDLVRFIEDRYQREIDTLNTDKGKEGRREKLKGLKLQIKNMESQLVIMFRISELMTEAKKMLIDKLKQVGGLGTFLETSSGLQVTAPEGFVAVDHISGSAVKLVDRLEFSRANFNLAKNWK